MPTDPQEDKPVTVTGDENSWLLQFYTSSKTTLQTEYSEAADSAQESPAAQLSTLPGEKYTIGEDLGTGAMKRVRRTLDKNAARDVALAVMLDAAPRSKKVSRFVREARITAALEHPNIVPIYDIGVDEAGKPYFTMKLLGGETLHSILQKLNEGNAECRKMYPLNRLLQIFLSVCNAVSFAHSRGVIHLDLKPANIQVGDFGEVLVLDWGLAKVLQKDPALFPHRLVLGEGLREIPSEGVVRGTPGFMGPEQARGEYASLNEQTDIFALGAVLYTILKCKPPSKKRDAKPKGVSPPGFKIPTALEAVTTKAMARLPADRYQTAGELAGDVQAFLDGYATKAQQAGALTLLWLLIKRHYVVTTLVCLSMSLVFIILAVSLVFIRHSEKVAVDALDSMKRDEAEQHKLYLLAAPRVFQEAQNFLHMIDYDQALSSLEYEVTLDSDNRAAWEELGALRLGRQEFEQANQAFSHVWRAQENNPRNGQNGQNAQTQPLLDLPSIAWRYAGIARENGGTLPIEKLEEFLTSIQRADRAAPPQRMMALGAFFKTLNRNLETANFDLIERMLQVMNPDSKNLEFSHEITDDGLRVSLHGNRISQIVPLTGLPITNLDLSNMPDTPSDVLDWVRDMPLVSVDLSQTRITDLGPLSRIPTLTELRLVNTHERDFNLLRSMSQLKRIVVSKAELMDMRRALIGRTRTPPEIVGE